MKTQILFVALLPLFAPVVAQAQDTIVAAKTEQKADEPNARLELARATEKLVDKDTFGAKQSLERERKLMEDNAEALQLLRAALELPYRAAPLPTTFADVNAQMTDDLATFGKYRYLARLLATESRVRATDKNFAGALQSAVDARRLGVLVGSDGPLIQMMNGAAIEAIARKQLRALLPQLDATNAKTALQSLQSDALQSAPYARTVRVEATWSRIFVEELWKDVPQLITQQVSVEWGRLMQQEIAHSGVPYIISEQQARGEVMDEEFIEDLGEEETVPDEITAEIVPDLVARQFSVNKSLYRTSRLLYEKSRAQNALLLAEFALHAYELEHQKTATRWEELVPAYLPQAPTDPFDYEHALRLATRDGKSVAYSIGPDGLDDKGAPIDAGADAAARRFRVEFNSRGDIVSGVNGQ